MRKILIFHPYLAPYRIDLYNELSKLFKLKVILTGSEKEIQTLGFDLEYINKQASFEYEYVQNGYYLGRHLISLVYVKEIRSFKPNLVLAHELGINTLFSVLMKPFGNYKLWVTMDDSPKMIKNYGKIRRVLQQFVVKNADKILVVHPAVREFLTKTYHPKFSCSFNYFPIIQNENKLLEKLANATKKSLELTSTHDLANKTVLLFVGRLESVKSPDLLVKAFSKIDYSQSILVFVGGGSMELELKDMTISLNLSNHILFTGKLTGVDLYSWFNIADVFVLPSQFEPFGAVVNEALVSGCQVVVSDRVGANCLVNDQNGIVFKSEEINDLSEALSVYTKRKYKKVSVENRMPVSFFEYIKVFLEDK